MADLKGSPFEFDQNNELHRKAQYYLETMDRERFPTFGDVIVTAIVDYFDRLYAEVPETVAADAQFQNAVEKAVEDALEKKLPGIIGPMLDEYFEKDPDDGADEDADEESVSLESVEKDINWGFLGG